MGMMQSPNTGVGGKDHGNREKEPYKNTYCYSVKFFDEDGRYICKEPFTVEAHDQDDAWCWVDDEAEKAHG